MASRPHSIANRVPTWKYTSALTPVTPTFFRSATLAMPPTIVRNMIGPISIFIAEMKVVPIGSIACQRPATASRPIYR